MAKAYLNESSLDFQTSASVPLTLLITRFLEHSAVQEFVLKFVTVAMAVLSRVDRDLAEGSRSRKAKIAEFERQLEEARAKAPRKRRWPP